VGQRLFWASCCGKELEQKTTTSEFDFLVEDESNLPCSAEDECIECAHAVIVMSFPEVFPLALLQCWYVSLDWSSPSCLPKRWKAKTPHWILRFNQTIRNLLSILILITWLTRNMALRSSPSLMNGLCSFKSVSLRSTFPRLTSQLHSVTMNTFLFYLDWPTLLQPNQSWWTPGFHSQLRFCLPGWHLYLFQDWVRTRGSPEPAPSIPQGQRTLCQMLQVPLLPKTVKALQSFFGFVNYYCRLISNSPRSLCSWTNCWQKKLSTCDWRMPDGHFGNIVSVAQDDEP